MGDSENSLQNRPRPARVVCGGTLAWAGLFVGALIATPKYQLAHTTGETPESMSWAQLVERGLFDNAHVRLTDVRLTRVRLTRVRLPHVPRGTVPEDLVPEDLVPEDLVPEDLVPGDLEFGQSEGSSTGSALPWELLKVVPLGSTDAVTPGTVLVAPSAESVAAARAEVDASGTLTGRFQPVGRDPDPGLALLTESAEASDWLTPDARYVYVPVDTVPDRVTALGWFVASILAVVIGLVMAGSGRPGRWMWLAMTIPSSLSLLGRPLRRKRNRSTWQTIYAAAGLGLIYYGYRQLTVVARWSLVDVDAQAMTLGFLAVTLGLASISGAAASAWGGRLRWRKRQRQEEIRPQPALTCATVQRGPTYSRRYFDPKFRVETDVELDEPRRTLTEALGQIDFESPLLIQVIDDDRVIPTTVQMGCQSLAMAIVETTDGEARMRLVTVLDDGFVVITVAGEEAEPREGDAGVIDSNPRHEPVTVLSAHLDRITALAEQREAAPLMLHSGEWRDVYLVAGRVSADIDHRHGASNRSVGEAVHGRFPFPPAPKQPLAGCLD